MGLPGSCRRLSEATGGLLMTPVVYRGLTGSAGFSRFLPGGYRRFVGITAGLPGGDRRATGGLLAGYWRVTGGLPEAI